METFINILLGIVLCVLVVIVGSIAGGSRGSYGYNPPPKNSKPSHNPTLTPPVPYRYRK